MTRILAPLAALALFASPLGAQEPAPAAPSQVEEGFSLLEDGARMLLDGLMGEMEPALEDAAAALAAIEPAMRQMLALVDDIGNYEAPERLPNGDILIRRKPGSPPPPALPEGEGEAGQGETGQPPPAPEGQVDL
jgi:hypothetical protein